MKNIIMPGDLVADRPIRTPFTYVEGNRTYSKVLGMRDGQGIIPLEGAWKPQIEDIVVGIVKEEKNKVYIVDLFFPGRAILLMDKYEKEPLSVGTVVEAVIKDIEGRTTLILHEYKVLEGGMILNVKPSKIPRIIGKANTMIKQISELTRTRVAVGTNGVVWLSGGDVELATAAIMKIENEAHVGGLTERIKIMLENKKVI